MQVYKTVTIAGSDSSGGAGIQADLKTFQELGVYGMSALTTIVAQDESWGHHVFPVEPDTVAAQLRTALEVIGADACKTGMLGSIRVIELVAQAIAASGIQTIVIDPVMICKGVDEELHPEVNECLREVLVPLATVVTPNLIEAAKLSGMAPLQSVEEMKEAARRIHRLGPSYVLVKGEGGCRETMRLTYCMTAAALTFSKWKRSARQIRTGRAAPTLPQSPRNWQREGQCQRQLRPQRRLLPRASVTRFPCARLSDRPITAPIGNQKAATDQAGHRLCFPCVHSLNQSLSYRIWN